MTEEPNREGPLVVRLTVELITYAIYLSWLSVIAAGALYLEIPPLPAVQDAVAVPWQGTAAAIAVGVLTLAVLRVLFDAIRGRVGTRPPAPPPPPPPPPEDETPAVPAAASVKRTRQKKKKKKSRRSRKR